MHRSSSSAMLHRNSPDSEKAYQVGQWSSWFCTALVILVALLARYHDHFVRFICDCERSVDHSIADCFHHRQKRGDHVAEHDILSVTWKPHSDASTSSKFSPTSIAREEEAKLRHMENYDVHLQERMSPSEPKSATDLSMKCAHKGLETDHSTTNPRTRYQVHGCTAYFRSRVKG